MLDFLRTHQLNIMLSLSSICGSIAFFIFVSKTLPKPRKRALVLLELSTMILLLSDRYAYIYHGDVSAFGFWMVRITNFLVYFFSLFIIYAFNLYLTDLLTNEDGSLRAPGRMKFVGDGAAVGALLVVVSQFTGFYYTFDEMNRYQRSPGFILSYAIPVLLLLVQFSAIVQYYGQLRRGIGASLLLAVTVPLAASAVQIFSYGLSLTNLSLAGMAILLYVFSLLDTNETVERANRIQIESLQEKQRSSRHLFNQMALALAGAIDKRDRQMQGHSVRVAGYAEKIARLSGKSDQECDEVYYAALLHDVGKLGLPDSAFGEDGKRTPEERSAVEKHVETGREILSGITEFPGLSTAAYYHHERYDGTGYPEKRKGEAIPALARLVAVADAYDAMTSGSFGKYPLPQQAIREEFVKGAGTQFDPLYAKLMLQLIDTDRAYQMKKNDSGEKEFTLPVSLEENSELLCGDYKSRVSEGIRLSQNPTRIHMECLAEPEHDGKTAIPAIILFDSLDGCVHTDARKIKNLRYLEYGEIWFDGHIISTAARNMRSEITRREPEGPGEEARPRESAYEVEAVRCGDHVRIRINSGRQNTEVIIALPDSTKIAYVGLTGEHCRIRGITVEEAEEAIGPDEIPRIAREVSYINRMEGDIPNLQINGYRSAATQGLAVANGMQLSFHTMSLPTANLVWHCPYVVLFCADDKKVNGRNYREFALIRLDGEAHSSGDLAENRLNVSKNEQFKGWDAWKEQNKNGFDCVVTFMRRGNRITTSTVNQGIEIRNVTTISNEIDQIYAAITGDRCALTDIRIL